MCLFGVQERITNQLVDMCLFFPIMFVILDGSHILHHREISVK